MIRFRFTLRTLLVGVFVISVIIGAVSYHLKAVARLRTQLNLVGQGERAAQQQAEQWRERAEFAEEYRRIKGMLELIRLEGGKGIAGKAPRDFVSIQKGPGAIPALLEAIDDPVFNVKAQALTALMNLGDGALPAIPRMIELLVDDDAKVRAFAAYALSVLPAGARDAREILILLLDDESSEVRYWASIALEHILTSLTEEELSALEREQNRRAGPQ